MQQQLISAVNKNLMIKNKHKLWQGETSLWYPTKEQDTPTRWAGFYEENNVLFVRRTERTTLKFHIIYKMAMPSSIK